MNFWKAFLRWRHSKGFGVHSPFAFRFVNDVLRPGPYRYYSYLEIDELLEDRELHDHYFIRLIHFTIRLTIFLKAKRIILAGKETRFGEITAKVLKLPFIKIKEGVQLNLQESDLLILSRDSTLSPAELEKALAQEFSSPGGGVAGPISVFAIDPSPEMRQLLETPITKGILLNDKKRMILVYRKEMDYVAYDMKLRFDFA